MKTSKETLFNLSSDATSTLKSVRNKVNTRLSNISLGKAASREDLPADLERPITLPPERNTAFSGIQFNSPFNSELKSKSKTKASYDLTDSTYEVPKRRHSELAGADSEVSLDCPSYEEAVRSNSTLNESFSPLPNEFSRNCGMTQSMMSTQSERTHKFAEKEEQILSRRKSETNLTSASSPEEEIPCPDFPPPILSLSPVYGKINKSKVTLTSSDEDEADEAREQPSAIPPPPIRHRTRTKAQRNKEKEEQEEEEDAVQRCSNRATIDPEEYQRRDKKLYPRLDPGSLLPEKETSKCDSWSFYDVVAKDEILSPIKTIKIVEKPVAEPGQAYENVEPVYGTVFNENEREKRTVERILQEFDPLLGSTDEILGTQGGKSNHLLLLETLLGEETYGTVHEDNGTTSDDDSSTVDEVPIPPNRQESLPNAVDDQVVREELGATGVRKKTSHKEENNRPVMIIHQNSNLRSDSMENIVEETELDKYMAQETSVEETGQENEEISREIPDIPHSSLFYVDQNRPMSVMPTNAIKGGDAKQTGLDKKKKNKSMIPSEPPPSYQEVLKEKAEQDVNGKETPSDPVIESGVSTKKPSMISKFSNVFNRSLIRRSSVKSSNKPEVMTMIEMVPRPSPPATGVDYEGHLVRYPTGVVEDILKEIQFRHTTLKNRTFYTFLNSEHKNPKESFAIDDVTTIQGIVNQKMTNGQMDIHCFEVTVEVSKANNNHQQTSVASNPNLVLSASNSGNSKTSRVCHVYGCVKQSERSVWMQRLLENMTTVFPKTATQDYKRAGWCYMKNSISASWSGGWLLLQRRKLLFHFGDKLDVLDLRKARCIVLKEADESINNLRVETGPTLMIDCPPFTLYLIMNWPRETKVRILIKRVSCD